MIVISVISARDILDEGLGIVLANQQVKSEFLDMVFPIGAADDERVLRDFEIAKAEGVEAYFEYFSREEGVEVEIDSNITEEELAMLVAQKSGVTLWGRLVFSGESDVYCVVGINGVSLLVRQYCDEHEVVLLQSLNEDEEAKEVSIEMESGTEGTRELPSEFEQFEKNRHEVAIERASEIRNMILFEEPEEEIELAVESLIKFYPHAQNMFKMTQNGYVFEGEILLRQLREEQKWETQMLYDRAKVKFQQMLRPHSKKETPYHSRESVSLGEAEDEHMQKRFEREEFPFLKLGTEKETGEDDVNYNADYVTKQQGNVLSLNDKKISTDYPTLDKSPASLKWIYREIIDMIIREASS